MYKKILIISLLIIILISTFTVNCYASTFNLEFNFSDKGYDLPDINIDLPVEFKYFILIKSSSYGHLFYATEEPPVFSYFRSSDSSYKFYVESGLVAEFILEDNATEWDFNGYGDLPYTSSLHKKVNYLYSNSDIKYNDEVIIEAYEETPEDSGNTGGTGDSGTTEDGEESEIQYYSFKGFDDVEYKLLSLPEGIFEYKHFIILKDKSNNLDLYGFNDSLEITHTGSFDNYNFDNKTTGKLFHYKGTYWEEMGLQKYYGYLSGSQVINSCIDLLKYEEDFNNSEGFFYRPLPLETHGTLSPIIHKVETKGIMKEIIQILPLIIVVAVSLVGLRKALKMLSTQLNRS